MNWLERLGEPLARTREEAEAYITAELERALPQGWTIRHVPGPRPAWILSRQEVPSGDWPNQDYGVQLPGSLDCVIFTHGNNDIGCFGLSQALQHALVIEAAALRQFGMVACLRHLMSRCQPNEWGYTEAGVATGDAVRVAYHPELLALAEAVKDQPDDDRRLAAGPAS
jgi:hypothetical protein